MFLVAGLFSFLLTFTRYQDFLFSLLNTSSLLLWTIYITRIQKFKIHPLIIASVALIPLFQFYPRYPLISLAELGLVLTLILVHFQPLLIFMTALFSVVVILLQSNIVNLPLSVDWERMIIPNSVLSRQINTFSKELLYLPFRSRNLLAFGTGYTSAYLANIGSFLKAYNFYSVLLPVNYVLMLSGIYYWLLHKKPRLIFLPILLTFTIAGLTKLPDKSLFLYVCRGSLLTLTMYAISETRISGKIYLLFLALSLLVIPHL